MKSTAESLDEDDKSKDVLAYYYNNWDIDTVTLPPFYYFKQRNKQVIDFVMNSVKDKESILMRGDCDELFKKLPDIKTTEDQLKVY